MESSPGPILKNWLVEIALSKLLTVLEPEKKALPGIRVGEVRYISKILRGSKDDSIVQFPQPYGRNTVTRGIWTFLSREHHREYLITAFGKTKGSGSKRPARYEGLHISLGMSDAANVSSWSSYYAQRHLDVVRNAEVLVFHNHPKRFISEILSQLLDWSPLPSSLDRETMFEFRYQSAVNWLVSSEFRNIHFYLAEVGRLREYQIPPAGKVVEALKAVLTDMKA